MIIYSKEWLGFPLLSRVEGSPIPRSLPVPILSTLFAFLLEKYASDTYDLGGIILHPYPYSVFATVLGAFSHQRFDTEIAITLARTLVNAVAWATR
eukprot:701032-Prorocentrum_minimum.AAC.3